MIIMDLRKIKKMTWGKRRKAPKDGEIKPTHGCKRSLVKARYAPLEPQMRKYPNSWDGRTIVVRKQPSRRADVAN